MHTRARRYDQPSVKSIATMLHIFCAYVKPVGRDRVAFITSILSDRTYLIGINEKLNLIAQTKSPPQ